MGAVLATAGSVVALPALGAPEPSPEVAPASLAPAFDACRTGLAA